MQTEHTPDSDTEQDKTPTDTANRPPGATHSSPHLRAPDHQPGDTVTVRSLKPVAGITKQAQVGDDGIVRQANSATFNANAYELVTPTDNAK